MLHQVSASHYRQVLNVVGGVCVLVMAVGISHGHPHVVVPLKHAPEQMSGNGTAYHQTRPQQHQLRNQL